MLAGVAFPLAPGVRRLALGAARRLSGGRLPRQRFAPRVVRLDYPSREIHIRVETRRELLGRANACAKEPWTIAWLERELRASDVLWDVGANVGGYTLVAAVIGGGARVVAVEPAYRTYASLCDNVLLNGVSERVTALPLALAAETRVDSLAYSDVAPGAASHALGSGHRAPTDDPVVTEFRQQILTYRLDDLLERFGLPAPTLLKLDVDGGEAAVLAGARAALASPTLRSVLVEIERSGEDDVLELLRQAGLRLAQRIDERDGAPLKYHWYGIFDR